MRTAAQDRHPLHRNNEPEYIPTRAMIWAECQRIQAGWTPTERRQRAGQPQPENEPRLTITETKFFWPERGREELD